MRYPTPLTVPITLTRQTGTPLHQQIAAQVESAVQNGSGPGRIRLPSTRTLADTLGVSRGVTTAAYELLFARGFLVGVRGSGTYVCRPDRAATPAQRRDAGGGRRERPASGASAEPVDLRPGLLDTD